MSSKDVYLVIGGSGFVGREIVRQLQARGDVVSVFDIVQRFDDTPFYSGDITDQQQVASALRKSGTTCIIHTASPVAGLKDPAIYFKVNVDGTKAVIAAAVQVGVPKLVFTSSAGVVFNGEHLINVDERLPYPENAFDAYNESKAKAEQAVLEANGKGGLLTVAIRPAGIFGPGDRQAIPGFYKVYEDGKSHFMIGDNNNLFDWTYVGNVAHAHLLAADKLATKPPSEPLDDEKLLELEALPSLTEDEARIVNSPLRPINLSTGDHRIPTCEARPLGPYVDFPQDGEQIQAAFSSPDSITPPPITRTRFDPLSQYAIAQAKLQHPGVSPLSVAGQAFFITNGEPMYFWDMGKIIFDRLDKIFPGRRKPRRPVVLTKGLGMLLGTCSEWYSWLVGKEAVFTRYKVIYTCTNRWHNIEKARRVLGYEPIVGIQEGIDRTMEWWHQEYLAGRHKIGH